MADSNLDHQMTEKEIIYAEFIKYEESEHSDNDDEDDFAFDNEIEDNDELKYQPNLDVDQSDAETEPHLEIKEELDDDYGEYELETATATSETSDSYFTSKNGTKWSKVAPPTTRIRAHNVVVDYLGRKPGPVKDTYDPYTIFRTLITEDMVHIIIRATNRKAKEVTTLWNSANPTKKKKWKPITPKEFDAFLAIVLYAGLCKSNNELAKDLWGPTHAPIYKAALSYDRFMLINKFIRFDNANTRGKRLINSKTAAIDEVWQMLQVNLAAAYTPHDSLTVGEQLFPYRGRTPFTQYIPSKPSKYGIKLWWLCDSKSCYPLKGMIYSGMLLVQEPEVNPEQDVVYQLVEKYVNTGRTIYADNIFGTLDVARTLMGQDTAFVGTVCSNETFVPHEFLKSPVRPVCSSLFGFYEGNVSLCSYVPKRNKALILLSTMHYTCDVDTTERRKPMVIQDYNANKSSVDTMDHMLATYSCKRATNRWPLAMFYNMVDIAALAAFVIYNEIKPIKKPDKRRSFLHSLTTQLAMPNIEERATNARITSYPRIRRAMDAFNVKVVARPIAGTAPCFAPRSNRPSCQLCRAEYGLQRKTRAYCFTCTKAVCAEHSTLLHRCNTCAIELENQEEASQQ